MSKTLLKLKLTHMSLKENDIVLEAANEARTEKNEPPITLQELINQQND